jgi:hypothetical protein
MVDRNRLKALAELAHSDLEPLARRMADLDTRALAGESPEKIRAEVEALNDEQEQAVQRIFEYLGSRRLNARTATMLKDVCSFDALVRQLVERIGACLDGKDVPGVDLDRLHADRQALVDKFALNTLQSAPVFLDHETTP